MFTLCYVPGVHHPSPSLSIFPLHHASSFHPHPMLAFYGVFGSQSCPWVNLSDLVSLFLSCALMEPASYISVLSDLHCFSFTPPTLLISVPWALLECLSSCARFSISLVCHALWSLSSQFSIASTLMVCLRKSKRERWIGYANESNRNGPAEMDLWLPYSLLTSYWRCPGFTAFKNQWHLNPFISFCFVKLTMLHWISCLWFIELICSSASAQPCIICFSINMLSMIVFIFICFCSTPYGTSCQRTCLSSSEESQIFTSSLFFWYR